MLPEMTDGFCSKEHIALLKPVLILFQHSFNPGRPLRGGLKETLLRVLVCLCVAANAVNIIDDTSIDGAMGTFDCNTKKKLIWMHMKQTQRMLDRAGCRRGKILGKSTIQIMRAAANRTMSSSPRVFFLALNPELPAS